jgi:hypothetical protein
MIPGTGPGRGLPWWRAIMVLRRIHHWGLPEQPGKPRPGRLIVRLPGKDENT